MFFIIFVYKCFCCEKYKCPKNTLTYKQKTKYQVHTIFVLYNSRLFIAELQKGRPVKFLSLVTQI